MNKEGAITDVIDKEVEKAESDKLYVKCHKCQGLVLKCEKKCINIECEEDQRKLQQQSSQQGQVQYTKIKLTEVTKRGRVKINMVTFCCKHFIYST